MLVRVRAYGLNGEVEVNALSERAQLRSAFLTCDGLCRTLVTA